MKYRAQGSGEVTERVNLGKWVIRNRFYTTRDINKWGMIYFGPKPNENIIHTLKEFETGLPKVRSTRHFSSGSALIVLFFAPAAPPLWNHRQS